MKTVTLSVLLAAGAALVGAANAQEAPTYIPSTPFTASEQVRSDPGSWSGDSWLNIPELAPRTSPIPTGVAALEANDFARAEEIFTRILRYNRNDAAVRFYLGVAKMNLGKWEDAKPYLEIAVRKKPKHPDPKSRLGVTYAKLGDTTGATVQRAELVKMAETCKRTCKDFTPFIAGGIEMIDKALGESREQGRG
jgi:tetratricopeptide (TPR) repeat protein